MKSLWILTLSATLTSAPLFAKEDPDAIKRKALDDVKRELVSLENLKAEKLEALEKKEAERWDARYRQAAHAKENEEKARALEEKYSRLASELTRTEEDLVKVRNETKDKDDEAALAKSGWEGFNATLKRSVDGAAENLSTDIPLALEERTLRLSHAGELLAGKNTGTKSGTSPVMRSEDFSITDGALRDFLGAGLLRLDLTSSQKIASKQSIFTGGRPAEAWQLQLGTVFIGELEKGGKAESQILLRTGNLQGRTFVWRADLAEGYNQALASALSGAAQGKGEVTLPLDVLQYKSMGSGFVKGEEKSAWTQFKAWFKAGGVTLYPLFAVGILSLLMILERLIYFARKNTNSKVFMRRFLELVDQRKWQEATEFCSHSGSALARALGALASHASQSREVAEKAVREAMLREVPALEKRLPLIAAMGAAAPLLGLLGTVSGLVTLFKVLNQLGANDPKVLAGGISEALINTETGLAIAIPVLLMHGFLNEKLDTINATLSSCSLQVLNKLWPKG
jgi:biopolymer transport protein ExbB